MGPPWAHGAHGLRASVRAATLRANDVKSGKAKAKKLLGSGSGGSGHHSHGGGGLESFMSRFHQQSNSLLSLY